MSVYSLYKSPIYTPPYKKRYSITMLRTSNVLENGVVVRKSEFVEVDSRQSPYCSMASSEFALDSILAAGGTPSQVFVSSNQVDSVIKSVENLKSTLQNVQS